LRQIGDGARPIKRAQISSERTLDGGQVREHELALARFSLSKSAESARKAAIRGASEV
jgi:hypothetical protein